MVSGLGLGYLTLDRRTSTLSAGEAQRLRLMNVIASGMAGLTVLLDEPTRGMHPTEVHRLVGMLRQLTELGNTAVVVEHDPDVMLAADHIIDLGPGAGALGGSIVAAGSPDAIRGGDTVTGRLLAGRAGSRRYQERATPEGWLRIVGARDNNLDVDEVRLPLGVLAGVCGVSGSGKSTLIVDTLARAVAPVKHTTSVARESLEPGEHDAIEGAPSRCIVLDQSRPGSTSPASFLNRRTPLQRIYGSSEDAISLGLTEEPAFSSKCGSCRGAGLIRIDMGFLPDEHVDCEACRGSGLLPEVDRVRLRGHTLPDLLALTVDEVLELWPDEPRLTRILKLAADVGLGYLVLQQPARSLSGGEIQRLKIVKELGRKSVKDTLYILDEPTAGLHLADVEQLIAVLGRLTAAGASVLVVEHNIDLLAACDWLTELGPGAGPEGGRIIAEGTPETLAGGATPTAPFLSELTV